MVEYVENYNYMYLVPDSHGNIERLNSINDFLQFNSNSNKWIAIEYVLHGLQKQFNKWLGNVDIENVTDVDCEMCCKVFIYGKNRKENDTFSKLYTPTLKYTRQLIKTLKKFEYVICLESNPRPSIYKHNITEEEYWIGLIGADNLNNSSGVILVGAQHTNVIIYILRNECLANNIYTLVRDYIEKKDIITYAKLDYNRDRYITIWSNSSIKHYHKQILNRKGNLQLFSKSLLFG